MYDISKCEHCFKVLLHLYLPIIPRRCLLYSVVSFHLRSRVRNLFLHLGRFSPQNSLWTGDCIGISWAVWAALCSTRSSQTSPGMSTTRPLLRAATTCRSLVPCPYTHSRPKIPLSARKKFQVTTRRHQSATVAANDPNIYPTSHADTSTPYGTQNFLDNKFIDSEASSWIDLHDPATNNLVTRVPQSTDAELDAAVRSAQKAFPAWRANSLLARQQIMFKFVALIRQHWDRLAASITLEQGKTFADAKGDVLRGLQVAETACGITTQMTGEVLEVAKDMETRSYREPLGVVAAICPFSQRS